MRSVEVPELVDLEGLGSRELEQMLRDVDTIRRSVEAMAAEIVGAAERTVAYGEDGHASVSGWVKAICNSSTAETRAVVQTARLLHAIPEARTAAHAGGLGSPQLRLLAKVFANPRSADYFPDSAALLVDHAGSLSFNEFEVVMRRWETLADVDGAHSAHERAHQERHASLHLLGERAYFDACGGVVAGSVMEEVFSKFRDAEFRADWEAGVEKFGEAMNPSLLERTDPQRRFDAFLAIITAAASSGVVGVIEPLVNIVVDQTTFEHHLHRAAGIDVEALDPATVDERRCETMAGVQMDPVDVLAAVLIGHARRVVFDTAGVVIDLGRRRRLFTGGARDAVMLGDRWCLWPGCDLRSGRCQTDHTQPWAHDGPTRPENGGAGCGRHNRFKQRGYRTVRDDQGRWHTYRPDGTELAPLPTPASNDDDAT